MATRALIGSRAHKNRTSSVQCAASIRTWKIVMAEGVNDDMSQQQTQDGAPHGQDVPCQELDSTAAPIQLPVASVSQSFGNGGHSSINPSKKKSSFQITSITQTKSHSRGDSNGYGELEEDLNESDLVSEVEVLLGYEEKKNQESTAGNGNGGSRFKVVKISRSDAYERGRWMCSDFPDSTESIPPSKENAERPDVQISNSKHVSFNTTSNHVAGEMDFQGDQQVNSKSTGDTSSTSSSSTLLGSEGAMKLLKKRDSDIPTTLENNESLSSNAATSSLENIDKLSAAALSHTGDPEMPIVNMIASAMEQILQIKSDLLSVVNKEVQTLKETITQLKEENEELKQENQRLRQIVNAESS